MKFTLIESIINTYRFVVIDRHDNHYQDEIDAYSLKQANLFAHKKHKGCYIRDMHQVTNNEDPDGTQLSMFEGWETPEECIKAIKSNNLHYDEDTESYGIGDPDDIYVQFQDRESHAWRPREVTPRTSTNTWLRIWDDGKLVLNISAPKFQARSKAIEFLKKYTETTTLGDEIDMIDEAFKADFLNESVLSDDDWDPDEWRKYYGDVNLSIEDAISSSADELISYRDFTIDKSNLDAYYNNLKHNKSLRDVPSKLVNMWLVAAKDVINQYKRSGTNTPIEFRGLRSALEHEFVEASVEYGDCTSKVKMDDIGFIEED